MTGGAGAEPVSLLRAMRARRTQGTTGWWASPQSLGEWWNNSSWNHSQAQEGQESHEWSLWIHHWDVMLDKPDNLSWCNAWLAVFSSLLPSASISFHAQIFFMVTVSPESLFLLPCLPISSILPKPSNYFVPYSSFFPTALEYAIQTIPWLLFNKWRVLIHSNLFLLIMPFNSCLTINPAEK